MPGHKRNKTIGIPSCELDITEINGFDNLHAPNDILKKLQNDISKLYKSKKSFLLTNGSTCGILAAIHAMCSRGDKILIARNCHKSVYNACELLELDVYYIQPKFNEKTGISLNIEQKQVDKIIQNNPDIKAIVITSPTYEGVISKINTKIPLIIDSAHGAHFGFANWLPPQQNEGDIIIQSLHKTLPALTQCAVIHLNNDFYAEKIKKYIDIFETSSPSYVLMISAEKCIDYLKNNADFNKFKIYLDDLYETELKHLQWILTDDITKINISTIHCNISGADLAQKLRKHGIEPEMESLNHVVLLSSIADTKEGFELLKKSLIKIDSTLSHENKKLLTPALPIKQYKSSQITKTTPVFLEEAENKICGEYIFAYPPGIPILVPGEVISKEIILQISQMLKNNIKLISDSNLLPGSILTKL